MDSKNVIWLSSFFALLFITFCVTKHLDELNPNIISLPETEPIAVSEPESSPLDLDILPASNNTSTSTHKDAPIMIDTPILKEEQPKVKTEIAPEKESHTKEYNTKEKHPVKIKPAQKKRDNASLPQKKSPKKVNKSTRFTIDRAHISTQKISQSNTKEFNELNKVAFKYALHKAPKIYIYTARIKAARKVKSYLVAHHVKAKDIKIIAKKQANNQINLILRGRK